MDQFFHVGSSGEAVGLVQQALNHRMPDLLPPLVADRFFGGRTEARVREFQRRCRLRPDGIVGPLTLAQLNLPRLDIQKNPTLPQGEPSPEEEIAWERAHPGGGVDTGVNSGGGNMTILWNFAVGSAQLKSAHMQFLFAFVKDHAQDPPGLDFALDVVGHSSGSGSSAKNRPLSLARAQAVRAFLKSRGLPHDVEIDGEGSDFPRVPNTTAENMARNRRVEISLGVVT
jgi:outer membrane protein OmpA-like peptidoglycan-associated protein